MNATESPPRTDPTPQPLSRRRRWRTIATAGALLAAAVVSITLKGCIRSDEGVWLFDEAPLPEGWPAATPVGEVQVKRYPAYRVAIAGGAEPTARPASQDRLFGVLFSHIKDEGIPMTAPVEMSLTSELPEPDEPTSPVDAADRPQPAQPRMSAMGFLYRSTGEGKAGDAGDGVRVVDVPEATYASIGVRGTYEPERYARAIERLNAWLDEHADAWQKVGDPRVLGYNSPLVPAPLRYGEVQIRVEPVQPVDPTAP